MLTKAFFAAALAAIGVSAFGFDPPAYDATYTEQGVTYAQRGGLGMKDFVVTNIVVNGQPRPLPPYLYLLELDDTYPDDAEWYYQNADYAGGGRCSVRRDGNVVERNYDWHFDDAATFVLKVSGEEGRRFASVSVANVGTNLTDKFVRSGAWSRFYKCLAGHSVDGVNENGVFAEVNVTSGSWGRTSGTVHGLGAVRWVLDHGTNAQQAAEFIAANVYLPEGFGVNFHYLIADADSTYIVENRVAHRIDNQPVVMTNFNLDRQGGEGYERYDSLTNGATITSQWWTLAYEPETRPIRLSDLGTNYESIWERWAFKPRESHRGEVSGGQTWWQTVHTSIYDIQKRSLSIAVQEQDDWYTFALGKTGIDDDEVRRIADEEVADYDRTNLTSRIDGRVPWTAGKAGNKSAVVIGSAASGQLGRYVMMVGEDNVVTGNRGAAFGQSNTVSGNDSFAAGEACVVSANQAHAEGYGTRASADETHAEGFYTVASGEGSHSEGNRTTASGVYSHAEGQHSTAAGEASHAGGHRANTLPDTKYGFAHGNRTIAATGSIALGYQAVSAETGGFTDPDGTVTGVTNKHKYAFVWQGKDDGNPSYYHSHGDGTFNVNPIGGLTGFWIGSTSLQSLFAAKQATISDLATIRTGASLGATAVQPYDLSADNPVFSNAVLAVGLNIDTNSVAVLNDLANTLDEVPIEGATATVGGLLAMLAAAVAWLKKHALKKGMTDGVPDDPNVADFFSESNTQLTNRVNTLVDDKIGDINDALDELNGEVA